jgi:hypothetical protein
VDFFVIPLRKQSPDAQAGLKQDGLVNCATAGGGITSFLRSVPISSVKKEVLVS